ncbi:MAG: ABC transporter ATP-binding protein [Bacteroidetes bacterium]|nr:MAG: ABC transporter ATP-binding protein [Bacteroidota bacterium]
MTPVIVVKHVSKDFKEIKALDDLSFSVPEGKVYGFLGQNGAGKSTMIRILLTLVRPTSGVVEIFGMDLKKNRKQILKNIGAIIERPDLYKYLTAKQNLEIFAVMSGVKIREKEIMEQLNKVGLAQRVNSKVKTYSQGMRQRLGIAVALIHDPELIILDEPMNGLDPQGIADVRNLILHLSKDLGKTLFVSSHLLSEMELIADSMLIIDKGKKIVEGKVAELLNPGETNVELETMNIEQSRKQIQGSLWGKHFVGESNGKMILKMESDKIPVFIRDISQMNIDIISVRPKHSLEDYFLSLTAHHG